MKIIVTGSCGFIGSHVSEALLQMGHTVLGIDNMNEDIYEFKYKESNQMMLMKYRNYIHKTDDIMEKHYLHRFLPDVVIHLAGYANVRISEEIPYAFVRNNVEVTTVLLQAMAQLNDMAPLLIYASSSSVYGNQPPPFTEDAVSTETIVSPYGMTKKMCEDMVSLYCRRYKLNAIGLRFFTVYGPRGRPDMAIMQFLKNIHHGTPITVYEDPTGKESKRDYTYISDIVDGILRCLTAHPKTETGRHTLYNLGSGQSTRLQEVIAYCEQVCGKRAVVNTYEKPECDVLVTLADIGKAQRELNYHPRVSLLEGIQATYVAATAAGL